MRCNADQLFEVSLRWRDSRDSKRHTLASFSMAGVEHSFANLFLRAPNLFDAQYFFGAMHALLLFLVQVTGDYLISDCGNHRVQQCPAASPGSPCKTVAGTGVVT